MMEKLILSLNSGFEGYIKNIFIDFDIIDMV